MLKCKNFYFFRSYSDMNLSTDYTESINQIPDHFITLISNDEIKEMFHSSDGVRQLQAAFLLSVRQNKVYLFNIKKTI
jgi:hypothetical protein